jgi:hypothetical protein
LGRKKFEGGRDVNDIEKMKVARDPSDLYFYVQTVDDITKNTGDNWMTLLLEMDRNPVTGWKGYDYRVIGGRTLQKFQDEMWQNQQTVKYEVAGNKMMITLPWHLVKTVSNKLNFEFKWSDHMQNMSDPVDWYINGDGRPWWTFQFYCE